MTMTVDLAILGQTFQIGCTEAEAPRIREVGAQLAQRIQNLQRQMGSSATLSQLLVINNLMTLDELAETQGVAAAPAAPAPSNDDQELMVKAVEHLTSRVNLIAQRLRAA